ncbi:hypothetical protein B0J11DRAFT_81939 [Dendryphion nanum]|uniref:DUF6594 domain-containing protein n=1 Tax=Dendryphion nanum TaxID=256645 RepID=A0A9P9IGB6_9PLEO|nr:hypothetical protein B0J11DRAFT_81939 [Dendryphion nanum]
MMASPPQTPLDSLVKGYPKLAGKMGIFPEIAIFRTFAALNARNLLYLQSELTMLENKLLECEVEDSNSGDMKKRNYARDYFWLDNSQNGCEEDSRQYRIVQEIRTKLAEYNHALIQFSIMAKMERPAKGDLKYMRSFLMSNEMGGLIFHGEDMMTWGEHSNPDKCAPDLVALHPRQTEDPFSMWVARNALPGLECTGWARLKKISKIHGVVSVEDSSIFRFTSWTTSIVASLVPIASILVLYTVSSMKARLGIIAAFNLLISFCVATFTNAKRSEVFAVTAAFAAVQVVFVGTDKDFSTALKKPCFP